MPSLQVTGMSCGHCSAAVTAAIRERDPAAAVVVDLARGLVEVESRLAPAEITAAIEGAGFTVTAGATAGTRR